MVQITVGAFYFFFFHFVKWYLGRFSVIRCHLGSHHINLRLTAKSNLLVSFNFTGKPLINTRLTDFLYEFMHKLHKTPSIDTRN